MKLISVIIPTYNRARYIQEAIDSVLGQELPKGYALEVIVADDGSTDNTDKLLKKRYGSKVTYVMLKHNGKPAVPRNAAIKLAKGELLAFQDSDDLWTPGKLKAQLPLFDDPKIMLSFGNAEIMDMAGKKSGKTIATAAKLAQAEQFSNLLQENVISTLTVMVRASALQETGGFNEADDLRAVEDYELWLRVAARFPKGTRSLSKTLAYYRRHDQNISSTSDSMAIQRLCSVLEALWSFDKLSAAQKAQVDAQLAAMQLNLSRLANEEDPSTKPRISVVMSVYNGAAYLRPALEGILKQTYKDFEFVIIDDGSTDDSVKIINSYQDPRIKLIRQPNHGLVYSLNKGVRLARGQFIARQDADDISLPSRLEKELALISSKPEIGVVGTFFTYIDEKTGETGLTICGPTKNIDIKRSMYFNNPFGHGTTMIRKSVFETVGYYSQKDWPTEDMELWQRAADRWEFAIVPESLYWYRINPASISHTKGDIQHKMTAQLIHAQWQKPFFFKSTTDIVRDGHFYRQIQSPFAAEVYNIYVARQIDLAIFHFRHKSFKTAVRTALGAIRLKPKCAPMFIKPAIRGIIKGVRG